LDARTRKFLQTLDGFTVTDQRVAGFCEIVRLKHWAYATSAVSGAWGEGKPNPVQHILQRLRNGTGQPKPTNEPRPAALYREDN
jgi:hypothetical protein